MLSLLCIALKLPPGGQTACPTHPRSARVAIGAGKHGIWGSEEARKHVFSRLRRGKWPRKHVETRRKSPGGRL